MFLKRFLNSDAVKDYDYIIIDAAPNWDVIHTNIYLVAEHVVVPVIPEQLAIDNIEMLQTCIADVVDVYELDDPNVYVIPNVLNLSHKEHVTQLEALKKRNLPFANDEDGAIIIPQDAQLKVSGADIEPFILRSKSRARKPLGRIISFKIGRAHV